MEMENITVTAESYTIPDEPGFTVVDYEYNIQYRWLEPGKWDRDTTKWHYNYTNKFSEENWYPSLKSVKNALAQMTATRYGYQRGQDKEYRLVRRPVGQVEVVDG